METGRMVQVEMDHGQRVWIFWFQNLFRIMELGIFMYLCQKPGALWTQMAKIIRSRVSLTNLRVRGEGKGREGWGRGEGEGREGWGRGEGEGREGWGRGEGEGREGWGRGEGREGWGRGEGREGWWRGEGEGRGGGEGEGRGEGAEKEGRGGGGERNGEGGGGVYVGVEGGGGEKEGERGKGRREEEEAQGERVIKESEWGSRKENKGTLLFVPVFNRYRKRRVHNTVNLLTGESDVAPGTMKVGQGVVDAVPEIISYYHPNLTINLVEDYTQWSPSSVPQPLDKCKRQR